jgi:hypothetical protein
MKTGSLFFSEAYQGDLFTTRFQFWRLYKDGIREGKRLYDRHYSSRHYKDGRNSKLFVGPGEKMVLMTNKMDAIFIWRKFIDASGQRGINCSLFRNESPILSSTLIKEAVEIAKERWPNERFYTYVNPRKIKSTNPGCCFKAAGWHSVGFTKGKLVILEYLSCKDGEEAEHGKC